jgi:hypothetical protein
LKGEGGALGLRINIVISIACDLLRERRAKQENPNFSKKMFGLAKENLAEIA